MKFSEPVTKTATLEHISAEAKSAIERMDEARKQQTINKFIIKNNKDCCIGKSVICGQPNAKQSKTTLVSLHTASESEEFSISPIKSNDLRVGKDPIFCNDRSNTDKNEYFNHIVKYFCDSNTNKSDDNECIILSDGNQKDKALERPSKESTVAIVELSSSPDATDPECAYNVEEPSSDESSVPFSQSDAIQYHNNSHFVDKILQQEDKVVIACNLSTITELSEKSYSTVCQVSSSFSDQEQDVRSANSSFTRKPELLKDEFIMDTELIAQSQTECDCSSNHNPNQNKPFFSENDSSNQT